MVKLSLEISDLSFIHLILWDFSRILLYLKIGKSQDYDKLLKCT